jgi:hypothetical protein
MQQNDRIERRDYEVVVARTTTHHDRSRTFVWPFVILLAAYCFWVLSLPLFPTQDDAMHLYYMAAARHLLAANSASFDAAYLLRNPPPPYVVHYALLLLLTSFLKPVLAEKCLVCVILISTAFGFRFLATAVGRQGGLMSLWIIPVMLSWPLFMGFHNYCLALSLSFWGYGIWLRVRGTTNWKLWLAFLLIVSLVLFTHPIPLLFLLGMSEVDLVARMLHERQAEKVTWVAIIARLKTDIACSLIACISLFYIAAFVDKASTTHDLTSHISRWSMLSGFARLQWMCFGTGGLLTKIYRCGLYAAIGLGFVLTVRAFRTRSNQRTSVTAAVLLGSALFLILILPFAPPNMNGSEHFSDRLPILVWICVLGAASSTPPLRHGVRNAIAFSGCLFSVFTLVFAERLIRPVAADISVIERDCVAKHKAGLLFDAAVRVQDQRLTFDPYLRWVGARYFRRSDAVLFNGPWLSPPFPLPIQRRQNALTSEFSKLELQDPVSFHTHLMNSPADRDRILSSVDVLLFIGKQRKGLSPDPLLTLDARRRWTCKTSEWYFVCEPERRGAATAFATHPLGGDSRPSLDK